MFEAFTERMRKVFSLARQEAQRLNSEFIGTEHILLGMIQEGGGIGCRIIQAKVDLKRVRQQVESLFAINSQPTVTLGQLPFSPRAKRVIELASAFSSTLGMDCISTEHLLVGLMKETDGLAFQALSNLGIEAGYVNEKAVEYNVPAKQRPCCNCCKCGCHKQS